jgi:hypothetical protein
MLQLSKSKCPPADPASMAAWVDHLQVLPGESPLKPARSFEFS